MPPTQQGNGSPWFPAEEYVPGALLKNLVVTFRMEELEHELVSGDGADSWDPADGMDAYYELHSSAATEELHYNEPKESGRVWGHAPNDPGDVIYWAAPDFGPDFEPDNENIIYQALVYDGCGNVPVFPIEFHSVVKESNFQNVYGEITHYDYTTLVQNGFWNFSNTIRAVDPYGIGVSDFHFKGSVIVECTNVENLE